MAFAKAIAAGFVFLFTAAVVYTIVYGLRWVEAGYGAGLFWLTVFASLITLTVAAIALDMRRYQKTLPQMFRFYRREWCSSSTDDKPPRDRP